jgi:hypothetical protein
VSRLASIIIGAVCAGLLAALPAGCATTTAAAGGDVTGGLTVEMYVAQEGESYARYRVENDGVLRFAGGREAQDRKFTWSGPMTGQEIADLRALIAEHGWFDSDPPSTGLPEGLTYEIRLRQVGRRRSFTVRGDDQAVAAVRELLATAARRRNEEFLRRLPVPGERP